MGNYTQELDGGAIEPSPDAMFDATDRATLDLTQSSFPIKGLFINKRFMAAYFVKALFYSSRGPLKSTPFVKRELFLALGSRSTYLCTSPKSRPYLAIGKVVGITEEEAFARVRSLKERKIIRRLGANFVSAKLGFRSTLCAAKVPEDKLESFIVEVNSLPGVTHNYLRSHAYNVWFTLIGPSWEEVCTAIEAITQKTGLEILNLPATRLYKIKVDFKMN